MSASRSRLALLVTSSLVLLMLLGAREASSTPAAASGLIAFQSETPDGINTAADVFTMNDDGSAQTQITFGGGSEPAWNADGTKIAFSTNGNYGDPRACLRNLFVVNPDGTGVTWILGGEGCSSHTTDSCSFSNFPSWSPDGAKIVYAGDDCFAGGARVRGGIFVVELATRTRTRLTTNREGLALDADPSWSHDGTKIAFSRADPSGFHIHVIDADGGNLTQLESLGGFAPAWSPDDSKIAFSSARDGNWEIWVMDADGSNPVQLTNTGSGTSQNPSWSPDGTRIVFESNRDPSPNGTSDFEIWTMNADGSSETQLTSNSFDEHYPDWQPSGEPPPPPPPPASGTIRIELDAVPDAPDDFPFQRTAPSTVILPFTLDDDGGSDSTYSAVEEFTGIEAGTWLIQPRAGVLIVGWQRSLSCTDPDGGTSTNALTATIDLDPGETVTCRYTHTDAVEPSFTLPVGVSANATGPSGAVVTYTVTATDNLDPSPTVSCSPPSGSLFAIGNTTVTCTAKDGTGNTATGSFTVHVRGAAEQIAALIAKTEAFVDDARVEAVLRAGLLAASQALAAGRKVLACTTMNAYIAAVRVLPTAILSASRKSQLIADAARIRAVIGC